MKTSKVSVVIVVYNGEKHIERSVRSILGQTFTDFELVIVNDGSTDRTVDIVNSMAREDQRINLISNAKNEGLIVTRNKGLENASGEYIAILDSDDLSYKDRLQVQVEFMDKYPEVGLCGSRFIKKYTDGSEGLWDFPVDDPDIRRKMFWRVGHLNSSVIIRKSVLDKYNIRYDTNYPVSEDYKLFFDIGKYSKMHNLPVVLGEYFYHDNQQTKTKKELLNRCSSALMCEHFELLGIDLDEQQRELIYKYYNHKFPFTLGELAGLKSLLDAFMRENAQRALIPGREIDSDIVHRFFECCYHSASWRILKLYFTWPKARVFPLNLSMATRFVFRAMFMSPRS